MGCLIKWIIGWPWCRHHWVVVSRIRIYEGIDTIGFDYHMRCSNCGAMKKETIK